MLAFVMLPDLCLAALPLSYYSARVMLFHLSNIAWPQSHSVADPWGSGGGRGPVPPIWPRVKNFFVVLVVVEVYSQFCHSPVSYLARVFGVQ